MKLLRCADDNKMKAEFKDGCVPIHECCDGPCLTVWYLAVVDKLLCATVCLEGAWGGRSSSQPVVEHLGWVLPHDTSPALLWVPSDLVWTSPPSTLLYFVFHTLNNCSCLFPVIHFIMINYLILTHLLCQSSICAVLRSKLWQHCVLLWQCSNHCWVVMGQNVIMFTGLQSQDGL